eukprot:gnl/MRDRNA2_/MRDRNA2_126729_c0_seq1.p1 gnl/MRDRNA2_/MRDRNA2_126729_c0~~gnl/MRDRNA2_/MRDRNA2_126729_c0_seq1.p1  ORF type:complete len:238 (+),score=45.53 gnl/MRDRNA2_/MRDRNA2_126729_c0_seq1:41-715(+)
MALTSGCWGGLRQFFTPGSKDPSKRSLPSKPSAAAASAKETSEECPVKVTALRHLQQLPAFAGCGDSLRRFWFTFAKLNLQELLERAAVIDKDEEEALNDMQMRCMEATLPFSLVLRLMTAEWSAREANDLLWRWNVLSSVRALLGRFPGEAVPDGTDQLAEVCETRRDWYMERARAFAFVSATLEHSWQRIAADGLKESRVRKKIQMLLLVQASVPSEWRDGP